MRLNGPTPEHMALEKRIIQVVSTILCEIHFCQFSEEGQVLGNISYGL